MNMLMIISSTFVILNILSLIKIPPNTRWTKKNSFAVNIYNKIYHRKTSPLLRDIFQQYILFCQKTKNYAFTACFLLFQLS